ncbi:uncharacterized protein I303_104599 [Kwoniella dejecticola CBS 10117]|uniref:Uncharacterized protein n=1 Tax=Kwoniella dejecticola CBS 10117 TaxID=1296121 RepID=A0A1A6A4V8_9TREE|nr:uncharacterized protein I303_04423 [Kwoniella dejecticola CBS 10117]OBR85092.1 hypothetical protein I303_04423 [Kwoniella dejecticola CBS 10117]
MPAAKREPSTTPSLEDTKPSLPSTPQKKARNNTTPKKTSSSPDKPKYVKQNWTAQEDAIFVEMIEEVLKEGLYAKIKNDGRLQREGPAVRAHLIAFINKVKRT